MPPPTDNTRAIRFLVPGVIRAWSASPALRPHPRRARLLSPLARRLLLVALAPVILLGCGCAMYLSFRSTGEVSSVTWMPEAIGEWADQNGRLRNLPAYFLLSCPVLFALQLPRTRAWAAIALGIFGTVLELAEYFVPQRMVEWQDVTWTWAGVLAAWILFEVFHRLFERLASHLPCPPRS